MPSGLVALLDDVAAIAKVAASSIDDVAAAAGKAGAKAAGVVIDDTAVTPQYVTGFTPDRELPIIWRIAKGSLKNKLIFLLPAALLLNQFIPWLITPLLMVGGAYLCFEGAEKVLDHFSKTDDAQDDVPASAIGPEQEEEMVSGAIRTDFILSAEIMAIALAEVVKDIPKGQAVGTAAAEGAASFVGLHPIVSLAMILAVVAIAVTVGVYGLVAGIVKMDDIGLHIAKTGRTKAARGFGEAMVRFMPKLLRFLSVVGTAAMIWVGGQIIVHGLHTMHVPVLEKLPEFVEHAASGAAHAVPAIGGLLHWMIDALLSGIVGLILGVILAKTVGKYLHKGGH